MEQQIPQFLNIQPKIAGPFTFKQLLFIAGIGLIVLILFTTLPFGIFLFIAIPLAGLALFLAFGKIRGFPAPTVLARSFGFLFAGKVYVWHKKENQEQISSIQKTPVKKEAAAEPSKVSVQRSGQSRLRGLSNMMELRK